MARVAVIGLGAMGSRIARRLLEVGHELVVWDRTREKLAPLVGLGAVAAGTPAEAARQVEILITMVADPASLQAVSAGEDGIAAGAHASLTVIEMSTVGPAAITRLESILPQQTGLLDAPVLGSIDEAEKGALTIFVGGPTERVEAARPLLSSLGSVIRVGELGTGAAAKLVANSTLFTTLAALGEAIALADGLGLSRAATYEVLRTTPLAAQAERRSQAIEMDDFPLHFRLALACKDAELIREAASAFGVELRLVDAARTWLADAEAAGWGDRDYSAMLAEILADRRRRR